jgi:hypothetical protein
MAQCEHCLQGEDNGVELHTTCDDCLSDGGDDRYRDLFGDLPEDEARRIVRVGKAVLEALATGGVGSDEPRQVHEYVRSLEADHSMFGAAVLRAIADAMEVE